jgi:hypothetical protein
MYCCDLTKSMGSVFGVMFVGGSRFTSITHLDWLIVESKRKAMQRVGATQMLIRWTGKYYVSWVLAKIMTESLLIASRNATKTWDTGFVYWVAQILGWFLYSYLHPIRELMKSVGSHGSSSLLLMIKVMVWDFVSDSHKVKTALILVLPCKLLLWNFLCNLIDMFGWCQSQRIKGEYDREADLLHKKYEALLTEEHRTFSLKQQVVQQNIAKVERNRQLAEALKLRELLVQPGNSSEQGVSLF